MPQLELDERQSLYYEYDAPRDGRPCFVFINAITGNAAAWQADIGPALRADGFGTLVYNLRGQDLSPFDPAVELTDRLIVEDLQRLMESIAPPRPVYVGLSIGGLFAARAHLAGARAEGLVLINTLRVADQRLDWISRAMVRAVDQGGLPLLLDLYLPMLVNPKKLDEMRPQRLNDEAYLPLARDHGHHNLLRNAVTADWDLPYEELDLPVLLLTGLQDRVFYVADTVAALRERLPDAREVTLADAAHLLPMERPAETVAALRDFAGSL